MKVENLLPKPVRKVLFKLSAFKLVPKMAGCYVLTSFEDDILYIGLSDNLHNRFQQHLDNPEKTGMTKNGKAVWFYFLEYEVINLEKLERSWLHQYECIHGNLPVLNKFNSPVG